MWSCEPKRVKNVCSQEGRPDLQSIDKSLLRLDTEIRKTGRISRREIEEILEDIREMSKLELIVCLRPDSQWDFPFVNRDSNNYSVFDDFALLWRSGPGGDPWESNKIGQEDLEDARKFEYEQFFVVCTLFTVGFYD